MSTTFSIQLVFATAEAKPGCGMFEIKAGCDLGGWMHLLLGDAVTGGLLGILFHHMSHTTQKKIEKILDYQQNLMFRRKDYSVMQLKTLFNTAIFTLGAINRNITNSNNAVNSQKDEDHKIWVTGILLSELRAEEAKLGRILQSIRYTLISSSDVMPPELIEQITGTLTFVAETGRQENKDGTLEYPKFKVCKSKINYLQEMLSKYNFQNHAFEFSEQELLSKHPSEPKQSDSSITSELIPEEVLV